MRLLYAFPEPLPLPRARGVQAIHAVHSLAAEIDSIDFAFEPVEDQLDPFAAYGLTKPANVRLLPLSRALPWPLSALGGRSQRMFVHRLGQALRSAAPDAVLVRHIKLACALGRRFPDLPLIYEAHEVFADTAPPRRRHQTAETERCALAGARAVVANSAATARRLGDVYPDLAPARTAQTVANAVTVPVAPVPKHWADCRREIVYSGSLFGWKGVDDLVAAAAFLPGHRITVIGGDADGVARLRALAPQDGAEIEFTGHLPHAEVQRRLANACIAVLPNRADPDSAFTSPLKLFEYLAAGCAVVATDLPAVRELLDDDCAAWAWPNDPESLAAALRTLCADPARAQAMAEVGFRRVQPYAWPARACRLRAIIEDVVNADAH